MTRSRAGNLVWKIKEINDPLNEFGIRIAPQARYRLNLDTLPECIKESATIYMGYMGKPGDDFVELPLYYQEE